MATNLIVIPGIGKTFVTDFARIGIKHVEDLVGKNADALYDQLVVANDKVQHKTSKNYLYVIRMAVYYANGGRDPDLLKWHAHKTPAM